MALQRACTLVPYLTHNDGMLQDLPLSGYDMRMDNDLWPVVRESARRILRLENILFKIPENFSKDFKNLCDQISENIPSRLVFPDIEIMDANNVEIYHRDQEVVDYQKIIEIGYLEPNTDVCWIECDIVQGWNWLLESCSELLNAGYPGCVGCGGPNSERRWDEELFRKNRKSYDKINQ